MAEELARRTPVPDVLLLNSAAEARSVPEVAAHSVPLWPVLTAHGHAQPGPKARAALELRWGESVT